MSACCVIWLPTVPTRPRLVTSAPTIAPTVLAAYTPPTRRAGSWPRVATAASASGKLAPHRMAPGSITQMARIRSSWNVKDRLVEIDGLMGQNGSELPVAYAAQASAAQMPTWHHPSAILGLAAPRASADPRLLPMPSPVRNTARIIENV